MPTITSIRAGLLADALKALAPIKAHASIPILTGIRLTPGQAAAANLEATGFAPVPGLDLDVLVHGQRLRDMVGSFNPDADLEAEVVRGDGEAAILRLVAGKAQGELPMMPTADYPELPQPVGGGITFSEAQVSELKLVAQAASRDTTRPMLLGVIFEWDTEGKVAASATDSYRLAVYQTEVESNATAGKAVIPAGIVAGLGRGEVTLSAEPDGSRVTLARDGATIVVRTISGQAPDWRQFAPEAEAGGVLSEDGVEEIGRLVDSLGDSRKKPIRLTFTNGSPDLLAQVVDGDAGLKRETTVQLAEPWPGESMVVGANPAYFSQMLAFGHGRLGLISPLRPIVFNGPPGPGRFAIQMPIRLDS